MAIRPDIKAVVDAELTAEVAKDYHERGCGTGLKWHFDGPGGAFAGYTVTTELDSGFVKVFPRVNATEKPDSHEMHMLYGEDVREEIVKRRAVRKDLEKVK